MKDRLIKLGYTITEDSQFQDKQFGITPELRKQLEQLGYEAQDKKNKKIIEKLTQLIVQFPTVPILKNYLTVAYDLQGNYKKAMEVNNWTLTEHPDYLFAKINKANEYIDKKDFNKVPVILGEALEIKQLYPERDLFHFAEVTNFYSVAIRYFAAIENLELAENRLKILKQIDPNEENNKESERYLFGLRLKNTAKRWEAAAKLRITPNINKVIPQSSENAPPIFNHPEIINLYNNGIRIPQSLLREIIQLPRQTLIEDLEKVINDSIFRYNYFKGLEFSEDTHNFVLHALLLLKEINATESLPIIFSFLSLDEKFLNFWLADHITESLWQCFYGFGKHNPGVLQGFLETPGIYTFCKLAVSGALCQLVLHNPEKREEVLHIFEKVLFKFSKASLDDNLIDSEFLGMAIGNAIDCQLHELLPIIKMLFDKRFVSLEINGDYDETESYFNTKPKYSRKKMVYTIFELYDDVLNTWHGYKEDHNDYTPSREIPQSVTSEKIGRNDDCPCGSGKKYKKCCMK